MTRAETLNEIEQLTMLAVARLGENAYGVSIGAEIADIAGREVSIAAIYAALDRLESRGLAVYSIAAPTAQRGGRRKRMVKLSSRGREALLGARAMMDRMWNGLELASRES